MVHSDVRGIFDVDSPKRRDTQTEASSDDLSRSLEEFLAAIKDPIGSSRAFGTQQDPPSIEQPESVNGLVGHRRDRGIFWLAVLVMYVLCVVGLTAYVLWS
jgi:hypothetical protein